MISIYLEGLLLRDLLRIGPGWRNRREAFLRLIRSNSLLDTNQRLRRTSAKTRLLETDLLKRRNSCSGVSFGFISTRGNVITPFYHRATRQVCNLFYN